MAHRSKSKANENKLRIKDVDDFASCASSLDVERPRCSLMSLPSSPMSLINGLSRKSISYNKLPNEPLKLSVLKLDGSCFYIEVAKMATVAELKLAVEAVFAHLPQKGRGKISWPHVWGHFCLCYNRQKLVIDTEYIRDYGIKDGDQLHFMRHVSITYNLIKKRSNKGFVTSKQEKTSRSTSISCDEEGQHETKRYYNSNGRQNGKLHHYASQGCFAGQRETRLTHLLGEWFSHCRITPVGKRRVQGLPFPSRITTSFLGGVKKIVQRCSTKWHPRNNTLQNTVSSKRYLVT